MNATAALAGAGTAGATASIRVTLTAPGAGSAGIKPKTDTAAEPQPTVNARVAPGVATASDGKAVSSTQQNGKAAGPCALQLSVGGIVYERGN